MSCHIIKICALISGVLAVVTKQVVFSLLTQKFWFIITLGILLVLTILHQVRR